MGFTVLLISLCATSVYGKQSSATEPDIEQITRQLNRWRESFVNLRLVWGVRAIDSPPKTTQQLDPPGPTVEREQPIDESGARASFHQEWIWGDHGLDLIESRFLTGNRKGVRTVDVWNGPGNTAFRARFMRGADERDVLKTLSIGGLGASRPISSISRTPLTGIYWPPKAEWLGTLLVEWKATIDGFESVGGQRCARIEIRPGETLWLDLEHDCLVKRYLLAEARDFRVDEFIQLETGFWFPKRGTMALLNEPELQAWLTIHVSMNQQLDEFRFAEPVPMAGTSVTDRRTGTVFTAQFHGDRRALEKAITSAAVQNLQQGRGSSWWTGSGKSRLLWSSAGLIGLAAVLLGTALWISRSRHNSKGELYDTRPDDS